MCVSMHVSEVIQFFLRALTSSTSLTLYLPPHLQQVRCLPPPASQDSWKHQEEERGQGLICSDRVPVQTS